MKHKKKIIAASLLLGLAAASRSPQVRTISASIVEAVKITKIETESQSRFAGLDSQDAQKEMRDSYLEISLPEGGEKTKAGLAAIAAGLRSANEDTRAAAIRYAESVLVKASHGTVDVNPEIQSELSTLVSLFKSQANERIKRIQAVFPESPTLAYLQKN